MCSSEVVHDRSHAERVFGLDVLRAVAIIIVLFAHSSHLLIPADRSVPWFPSIDGVDLFFVLSGYLVGGLLLKLDDEKGTPWRLRLLDFWQRRWLRTLPNYYLFLVVNVVLVATGIAPGLLTYAAWSYAVFMQNFHKPVDLFFTESWTLAVEEWFYIGFPILLTGLFVLMRIPFKRAFLFCALLFCLAPLIVRLVTIDPSLSPPLVDLYMRKLVITRLDAIGVGALAVWFSHAFAKQWTTWRWPAFLIGLAGLVLFAFHRPRISDVYAALYFSGVVIAIACLLPVLSKWYSSASLGRPVVFISRIAYALYLVHVPLLFLLHHFMPESNVPHAWIAIGYWITCVIAATVVLYSVELPFMHMRDRIGQRIRSWTSG